MRKDQAAEKAHAKAFSCKMCGQCCRGIGGITVDAGERKRIAAYLGMTPKAFLESCCERRNHRISIRTGSDGACLFFEQGRGCCIHPVKPQRCALWPFYPALIRDRDAWSEAMDACPGINRECSHEEFVRQARDAGMADVD